MGDIDLGILDELHGSRRAHGIQCLRVAPKCPHRPFEGRPVRREEIRVIREVVGQFYEAADSHMLPEHLK